MKTLSPCAARTSVQAARIIRETIARVISRVNTLSEDGPGWTRPSYSDLESEAHAIIEAEARELGLEISRDAAGNLFARMAGYDRTAPALYMGSHLDTVGQGGAYDGQAGVAGALAILAAIRAEGIAPATDIVLTVTRAEESVWFPVSYIGSRSALGLLTAEEFQAKRADTGLTLAEHMAQQGYQSEEVLAQTPPSPARFLEFHIEQGPVLYEAAEPYGIVTAIRGGLRYRAAQVHGTWAHSGAAPREGRADAVVALAELIVALNKVWDRILFTGADLTVTFGKVDAASPQHAMAKVAGEAGFCLDMRSDDEAVLEQADRELKTEIARIEAAHQGIRFELGGQSRSKPAKLSPAMTDFADRGAALRGDKPRRMLSGGGHDAAAFATAGWQSVMVFIRNWNGSHCPDEAMDEADLAAAAEAVFLSITAGAAS
ncbi:hydantoinase/carbamoylase family amidase [Tropicimonas sp. IMCC6043]|uniref:hydantoinase/carbamoylase family amidase n=1 Tax=Tropicimonas sp. IMCC6043 TaxID=2510645 RepID=UPI00101E0DB1|nr:hydantoinase/carbamoylase family amidase [Tropicimonas sp. IMCC6043]RYH06084.1 hydantoinase/carbamoylase family amidase [Tropicimonas sp. IMCC6043]